MIDETPFFVKQYPIPIAKRATVEEKLQEMIRDGIIEECATPYISPMLAVTKKNGSVRLCLDCRKLNSKNV